MKIYKYNLHDYGNLRIGKSVLECVEKSKTYAVIGGHGFKSRIAKEEIGAVNDWAGKYVLLLEDDFEKAKTILLEYYFRNIESENIRHKSQIEYYQRLIEKIKECG